MELIMFNFLHFCAETFYTSYLKLYIESFILDKYAES